ncbi:ABC transporter permease [Paractinoplanes toevensis]|uniref:ABC transporter permease n=1 Tax=Paractinoplanes toevensis TaxID=571911 RepID=A0A919T833_9ACTN|nr:ABC transporter permease [Actinoplanes toevensis]
MESLAVRGRQGRLRSAWRGRFLRIVVPAVLIVLWQLSSVLGWADEFTLPPPSRIIAAYQELWANGDIQAALPISLKRAGTGLAIGVSLGLVLGLFAGLWKIGEEIFDAPLQMLRTIPFIAVVPLFITWFGIGETPKLVLIAAATVFPMYLNTYHGVRGVDKKLIESGQTFGLRGWRLAARVILPTALPAALTGLRYAAGVSLLALVLAEQINAREGIGYLVNNANQNQRPDIVIAGILIYALLGIVVDVLMRLAEHFALPWRPRVAIG